MKKFRYIGISIIIVLTLVLLVGCHLDASSFFTIEFSNSAELTLVLNGTVVDKEGFNSRQGVNRIVIMKDNKPVWVGQWELKEGSMDEFIKTISHDTNWKVTQHRNRIVGIELIQEG